VTERITIKGREFTVTHDQEVTHDFTTPYLLTPVRKCKQDNYRLLRNKPQPNLLFLAGNNPFSAGGLPDLWVREVAPGVIEPIN
jgi:hypothetical protein